MENRGSWGKQPRPLGNDQWAPTPPASPASPAAPSSTWGVPNQSHVGTGWSTSNNGPPVDWTPPTRSVAPVGESWNSSAYASAPTHNALGHSRANSWGQQGGIPPPGLRREGWDSAPSWNARGGGDSASNWANTPGTSVAPKPYSQPWNPPARQSFDKPTWGAPPQPTAPPTHPNASGWSPAGWDPLPPVRPADVPIPAVAPNPLPTPGWDGRRPVVAGSVPSPQRPPASGSHPTSSYAPSTRGPNNNTPEISFSGRGLRRSSGSRTNLQQSQQYQSGPSSGRTGQVDRISDPRRDLRKSKSAFALAEPTKLFPNDNSGDRRPLGRNDYSDRGADNRNGQQPRQGYPNNNMARRSFSNLRDPRHQQSTEAPADGQNSEDGNRRTLSKPSSRLFIRQTGIANSPMGAAENSDSNALALKKKKSIRQINPNGSQDNAACTSGVNIYGFPKWVRVPQIIEVFAEFGPIVNVGIDNVGVSARPNPQQGAYAYVNYETADAAAKAVKAIKGKRVLDMDRPLELRVYYEQADASEIVRADSKVPIKAGTSDHTSASTSASQEDLRTLHLGNIPMNTDKSEIEKVYSVYGEIKRLHIVARPKDRPAYAFVSFQTQEAAKAAFTGTNGQKLFNPAEPLKIGYARIVAKRERRFTTDCSWDKEKSETSTTTAEARKPKQKPQGQRAARHTVHVREIPTGMDVEAFLAKLSEHGPIKAHLILNKETATGEKGLQYGLVVYQQADDAAKAVAGKTFGAAFPRQRCIHVTCLPENVTEADLRKFLDECGEINNVDIIATPAAAADSSQKSAVGVVNFARGDGAAKAMVKCQGTSFPGSDKLINASYAPPVKRSKDRAVEDKSKTDGDVTQNADQDNVKKENDDHDRHNDEDEQSEDSGSDLDEEHEHAEPLEVKKEEAAVRDVSVAPIAAAAEQSATNANVDQIANLGPSDNLDDEFIPEEEEIKLEDLVAMTADLALDGAQAKGSPEQVQTDEEAGSEVSTTFDETIVPIPIEAEFEEKAVPAQTNEQVTTDEPAVSSVTKAVEADPQTPPAAENVTLAAESLDEPVSTPPADVTEQVKPSIEIAEPVTLNNGPRSEEPTAPVTSNDQKSADATAASVVPSVQEADIPVDAKNPSEESLKQEATPVPAPAAAII
ncbi:hypothetical protein DFS34DRAFT_616631 [Phlyctochytrium arcticum]|nr:hypothetical protein DFS34DRAFT_616631 [Phlyctochytrium arcticum]